MKHYFQVQYVCTTAAGRSDPAAVCSLLARSQLGKSNPRQAFTALAWSKITTPGGRIRNKTTTITLPVVWSIALPYGTFFDRGRPITCRSQTNTAARATSPANTTSRTRGSPLPPPSSSAGSGNIWPIEERSFPTTSNRQSVTRSMYLECGFWHWLPPVPLKDEVSRKSAEAETKPEIIAFTPASFCAGMGGGMDESAEG